MPAVPLTYDQRIISAKPNTPGGGVLRGTSASVLPTDAKTVLDATFKPLGYITDAGVKLKPNVAIQKKKAWGGATVKVLTTDRSVEVDFAMFEFLNTEALKAAYGDTSVVYTAATASAGEQWALKFTGELPNVAPYVFEAKDATRKVRVVIPKMQIADVPEITLDDNTTLDLSVKAEAYPDVDGVLMYVYIDGANPGI